MVPRPARLFRPLFAFFQISALLCLLLLLYIRRLIQSPLPRTKSILGGSLLPVDVVEPNSISSSNLEAIRNASFELDGRRVLILAAATSHVAPLFDNLRCGARSHAPAGEERDVLLVALDDAMEAHGHRVGAPTVRVSYESLENISQGKGNKAEGLKYRSQSFGRVARSKLNVVHDVLASGVDVIFTDTDVSWCNDVPAALKADRASRAKARAASNEPLPDIVFQNALRKDVRNQMSFNSGFYYARSSPAVRAFFGALTSLSTDTKRVDPKGYVGDQKLVNSACSQEKFGGEVFPILSPREVELPSLYCRWMESVRVEALPMMAFPNGAYRAARVGSGPRKGITKMRGKCEAGEVQLFHANYMLAPRKIPSLQREQMWFLDENGRCAV